MNKTQFAFIIFPITYYLLLGTRKVGTEGFAVLVRLMNINEQLFSLFEAENCIFVLVCIRKETITIFC